MDLTKNLGQSMVTSDEFIFYKFPSGAASTPMMIAFEDLRKLLQNSR